MEQMREVINFLMENWHVVVLALTTIFSFIFGKSKIQKIMKEVADIFHRLVFLSNTIKKVLSDRKVTKEEAEELKEDLNLLLKEFADLITLFRK